MAILLASISFLFLIFSLGQVARIDIVPSIALTGLDIAVAGFVLMGSVMLIAKRKFLLHPIGKSFGLFILLASFSLFINAFYLPSLQFLAAFLYLVRYIVYGLLYFIIYSFSDKQKKIFPPIMTGAGAVMLLAGFVQFFFYPALRNLIYAGWDEHFYRMFGTFFDPNFLGLFFVLYFLLLLFLLFSKTSSLEKFLYAALSVITIIAIYLTYSRTALLALLIGVGMFLFILGKRSIIVILLSVLIVGAAITFLLSGKRSEGTNLFRTVSSEARIGNMRDAVTVWQDKLLFGVGFDAYRYAQFRHGIYKTGWDLGHGTAGADNSFLFVLATTGIVGFCAFLYFLFQHVQLLQKQKNRQFTSLGISTLVALSIGSFFINGMFYPSLMLWLWVILGLTENR